ncbi:hypothetical protein EVAR_73137_1 [Eumeta japonica]|uniref:Uncharacterized protein n=1 Tax=Eumeta variegata TaxID=151549 RepID=A0A4C1SS06_EUMVA|nr:hypothetical protein EVAR_73137_1 [Eumeta japonica]
MTVYDSCAESSRKGLSLNRDVVWVSSGYSPPAQTTRAESSGGELEIRSSHQMPIRGGSVPAAGADGTIAPLSRCKTRRVPAVTLGAAAACTQ